MKRFTILLLALLVSLPAYVQTPQSGTTQATARKPCCHGCGSKYCNRKNCGTTCKAGPKCQGCWKDTCATATVQPQQQPTAKPGSCPSSDYYVNLTGQCVHRPRQAQAPPLGATAQCRDGTYSFSQHHQGTCSHHGGVARWITQ